MACLQAEGNKEGSSAVKQAPQSLYQFAQNYAFIKVHALRWQHTHLYAMKLCRLHGPQGILLSCGMHKLTKSAIVF